jgi:bifunctional non-homologous end joining protein LigD
VTPPSDSLKTYREKRDFAGSPEPAEGGQPSPGEPRFVIQQHDATRMHYDVRLEIGGVLVSWAVPKGPSYDPDVKRLAIRTEDHPLSYADFEGVIPEGNYGAGPVIVWDRGTWERAHEGKGPAENGLDEGHLAVRFHGEKLQGDWALIRTGRDGDDDQWLFFKMKGPDADPERDITAERPESVISGRTINDLAESAGSGPDELFGGLPPDERANLIPAEQPEWINPMLATLTDQRFSRPDWIYEQKFDGERCLVFRRGDKVRLMSRNRNSINVAYPELVEAVAALERDDFILDGEIIAVDDKGRESFSLLQRRMHVKSEAKARRSGVRVRFHIFDLLHLQGYDTTRVGLIHRKQLITTAFRLRDPLFPSDHRREEGEAFYEEACAAAWEGLIAKEAEGKYIEGRTRAWLKFKCVRGQEFVIGGWTDPGGSRSGFGSLLLGYYEDGAFRYAGKVGTGFSDKQLREIRALFDDLGRDASPYAEGEDLPKDAHFLEPKLVGEVGYAEWTDAGTLRHPRFLGLRDDINPRDVVCEKPEKPEPEPLAPVALQREIKVSNPDKVLFADPDMTKAEFVDYYRRVAPVMLPLIEGRPLSMMRFPDGPDGESFYQKDAPDYFPDWIPRVVVESGSGGDSISYPVADSPEVLAYLANLVPVLHTWTSRRERLFYPDRMILDLDPAEGGEFSVVIETARTIRTLLEEIGLSAFVMTTGSRGLHVVTPLKPEVEVEQVAGFSQALAQVVAQHQPEVLTTEHRKAKRKGRLLIDPWRNSRSQTAVAPYSVRSLQGAPVATPVDWEELDDPDFGPQRWNLRNIPERLARRGDPWAAIDRHAADLRKSIGNLTGS